jgi:hypothetical protein
MSQTQFTPLEGDEIREIHNEYFPWLVAQTEPSLRSEPPATPEEMARVIVRLATTALHLRGELGSF